MHDFLITCGVTESPVDTSHAFECGTGAFFFHLTKPLIFIRRGRRNLCVYKYDSGIELWATFQHFKVPWLSYLWAALFVRGTRELNTWLHYSSLRIIVYDTKPHPRYVPRKQCASPSPVHPSTAHEWWVHSRRPPVPLGWQKIMSASRWETLRRSWCEQCLTLLPPRQMEPSKKKGLERSWKLPASLVIFSTYMTTCVHIHQLS